MMKWLYVLAGLAFGVKMVVLPHPVTPSPLAIVEALVQDAQVPNTVATVILRNRLFDTVSEVIVFTIAILGVHVLMANERPLSHVHQVTDAPSVVLAQVGAMISALVGVELAVRGHVSPGGGFAAGVAGGTAIGLVAMTSPPEALQRLYQRWHAATWEKLAVVAFIVIAVLTLLRWEGSWTIPLLNVLVAIKVTLGSWAMVLAFIRYRGLL
ncbi:MAG: Na(+)/H(+) antiporter subunit B [Gloeomargarita sp. SKYG116]|nr:Na(+)/H(+) antiporter subunit B [Gloeomargarita sp. SKYG116]MDW8401554.1 Na(+)/H(+) antiporter subunit B [Gloeomargarita sp. SKYGB_i_bin116]